MHHRSWLCYRQYQQSTTDTTLKMTEISKIDHQPFCPSETPPEKCWFGTPILLQKKTTWLPKRCGPPINAGKAPIESHHPECFTIIFRFPTIHPLWWYWMTVPGNLHSHLPQPAPLRDVIASDLRLPKAAQLAEDRVPVILQGVNHGIDLGKLLSFTNLNIYIYISYIYIHFYYICILHVSIY